MNEGRRTARMESGLDAAARGHGRAWAGIAVKWIVIGTLLQVTMVLAGHWVVAVANAFGILGTLISLVVGLFYAVEARISWGNAALGGAVVGAVCAFPGVLVSYLLGDVPAGILLIGPASGLVAGALGGLVGHTTARRRSR